MKGNIKMSLEQYVDEKGNFQLPLEKVLEKLSQQNTQQALQIASLQAALEIFTAELNERGAQTPANIPTSPTVTEAEPVETLKPDAVV